jgi:hypothetical protein
MGITPSDEGPTPVQRLMHGAGAVVDKSKDAAGSIGHKLRRSNGDALDAEEPDGLASQVANDTMSPQEEGQAMERKPNEPVPESVPNIDFFEVAENNPNRRRVTWRVGDRSSADEKPIPADELAKAVDMLQDLLERGA